MYGLCIEAIDRELGKEYEEVMYSGRFLSNVKSVQVSTSSLSLYILDW